MPGQQQSVPLHQPVDALGVDRGQTVGSPLALEERGDPPVPVGRARVDEPPDLGDKFKIAIADSRPTSLISRLQRNTLMSAIPSSRQASSRLSFKRLFQVLPGRAGGAVVMTTVDHTLMRGSEPHDR